jgi:hypothetical protein
MFTISLEDYPEEVAEDVRAIAAGAMVVGRVLREPLEERSDVEIVSALQGEPFDSARAQMLGRIVTYEQQLEV